MLKISKLKTIIVTNSLYFVFAVKYSLIIQSKLIVMPFNSDLHLPVSIIWFVVTSGDAAAEAEVLLNEYDLKVSCICPS